MNNSKTIYLFLAILNGIILTQNGCSSSNDRIEDSIKIAIDSNDQQIVDLKNKRRIAIFEAFYHYIFREYFDDDTNNLNLPENIDQITDKYEFHSSVNVERLGYFGGVIDLDVDQLPYNRLIMYDWVDSNQNTNFRIMLFADGHIEFSDKIVD